MAVAEKLNIPWTRKHDKPGVPAIPSAAQTYYPTKLDEIIKLCQMKPPISLKADGSHWALSDAAMSDFAFIETHDPANIMPVMESIVYDVIPKCMSQAYIDHMASVIVPDFNDPMAFITGGRYLIHFETGRRVYQVYSDLDAGDETNPASLAFLLATQKNNPSYHGPWAFHTLGGAGGQTVFGALTTGTHGGDFTLPPIADYVQAMHLVADGGKHYWIERDIAKFSLFNGMPQLTDDAKLNALYGADLYGGSKNFTILRDTDLFNSVLISAGRFGIVYSVVLAAVRQYCLREIRSLDDWQSIRGQVNRTDSSLYNDFRTDMNPNGLNKFLQIGVSVTPYDNSSKNRVGITKRWNVIGDSSGRFERSGKNMGNSHPYDPDPDHPGSASPASFLENACQESDIIEGAIDAILPALEQFVVSNGVEVTGAVAAAVALGGLGLLPLIPELAAALAILKFLRHLFKGSGNNTSLGEGMNTIRGALLDDPLPGSRAAGIFVWQALSLKLFEMQQTPHDYTAISYAVMDEHDYLDINCTVNVDSIEVFFDATDPMLPAYIDALLAFEVRQEGLGRVNVGYISLRFTSYTLGLIGMEKWPITCAVEIASLKDVDGSEQFVENAITLARNPNFSGILHWGQRNECTMSEIEARFGDTPWNPSGKLHTWRAALSSITDNGRLSAFSSAFTRQTGLEVVTPLIQSVSVNKATIIAGEFFIITWDATHNPPFTSCVIEIYNPDLRITSSPVLPLLGSYNSGGTVKGLYVVRLTATCTLNGESRKASQILYVNSF